MKLDSGSTDYFIVTLVAFEGNDGALATDRQIQTLKGRLGFPVPFAFNKVQGEYHEASLSAVAGSGWVPDARTSRFNRFVPAQSVHPLRYERCSSWSAGFEFSTRPLMVS